MTDKTGSPEAPDPYAWTPPTGPSDTWSDADWLRDMARANFVTEDIERADKIAARLDAADRALCRLAAICADHLRGAKGAHVAMIDIIRALQGGIRPHAAS